MPPLRECTLTAPASAVSLTPKQMAPYQKGDVLTLKAGGLVFEPAASKNIKGEPTGDDTTSFRCAINYHRALRGGTAEAIATYWHPAEQERVLRHFSQAGVLDTAQARLYDQDNVDLLGMLELNGREVIFIRYERTVHAFVTVPVNGDYRLVTDPGLTAQTAIACAAFEKGKVTMAAR